LTAQSNPAPPNDVLLAIIVPQMEEYKAVQHVLGIDQNAQSFRLEAGGTYVRCDLETSGPTGRVTVAVACMDDMYNLPTLALTERLLYELKPKFMFLVGSACGNIRKVAILDVVVSSVVAHLGRGRDLGREVLSRQFTTGPHVGMADMITRHRCAPFAELGGWNRACKSALHDIGGTSSLDRKDCFEVKRGIVASDDKVLSWNTEKLAREFWYNFRDDAHAYDMESAGFSYGCHKRTNGPYWAVVRGISDHGIAGTEKYHKEAATVAAVWVRVFVRNMWKYLTPTTRGSGHAALAPELSGYNWDRLRGLLEEAERTNIFVGKRRFIRDVLGGADKDIQALAVAIEMGGIQEYERYDDREAQDGSERRGTAVRLDKSSRFWYSKTR